VPTQNETQLQSEARRFVNTAWRIRRLVLWLEALIGLPMGLLGLIRFRTAPESLVALLLLAAPFIVGIPFVIYRLLVFRTQGRSVVLWVRRFHRGQQSTVEQALLEYAVTDWGQLVTIADDSVDTDAATRMMLGWKYFAVVVVVFAVALVGVAKVGVEGFIGGIIGCLIFLRILRKRARVNFSDTVAELPNTLARIRARKLPISGSTVLKCPRDSDLWRQVILDLSQTIDAAVVSAAENSTNVDWEIQTLTGTLGRDKIIVLTNGTGDTQSLPPGLVGAGIIEVPPKMRWWPGARPWRSAAITLGSAILARRKPEAG
jgi:hypothetical protein